MIRAAYLHIPFCEHICHYCDFNKFFLKGQPVDEYLHYLELEMKNTLECYPTESLNTIFVGGGTPTSLSAHHLEIFLKSIHNHLLPLTNSQLEFSFEVNPGGDGIKEKLQLLKEYGVNRISFGVQTFDDFLLEKIGRTHRKDEVFRTIQAAKEIGFENISLDLMFALPHQTIKSFQESLEMAFSLEMTHFAGYSLIIEPKTVFYNLHRKGKLLVPSQEEEERMYEILMEQMEKHGYKQYEISNFSLLGYESLHNLTYWNNEEYYGIGAGAHSYVNGVRRANAGPLKKYMAKIDETGFAFSSEHPVSLNEQMEEEMFLGLRKTKGVSRKHFKQKFNQDLEVVFGKEIDNLIKKGLLEENKEFVRLTHKGKFLGNEVFQAFIR